MSPLLVQPWPKSPDIEVGEQAVVGAGPAGIGIGQVGQTCNPPQADASEPAVLALVNATTGPARHTM